MKCHSFQSQVKFLHKHLTFAANVKTINLTIDYLGNSFSSLLCSVAAASIDLSTAKQTFQHQRHGLDMELDLTLPIHVQPHKDTLTRRDEARAL